MQQEEKLHPIHAGEVLLEEFLKPMRLSQNQLALAIHVPARRINEIVHGKRRITADTALRLARYFQMSPQFWLGLQMDYDLDVAEDALGERLNREINIPPMPSTGQSQGEMYSAGRAV
ncbi:MAG: HigA family addiction module antitoxin [Chloroflexota bacterium]|nr:HigA family addiction module antitoxin [Chloroflexota bacterium]